jgi:curli biogenesis system outer membrane secretion channel CsgG
MNIAQTTIQSKNSNAASKPSRRQFCLLAAAGLALAPRLAFGFAATTNTGSFAPKLRIAVMDLSGSALRAQQLSQTGGVQNLPAPTGFAQGLTEMLTTALVKSGQFVVLERVAADKVVGEQDFNATDRVNPETAAAKGKIIGAQALITGDITEFSYQQSSVGGNLSGLGRLSVLSKLSSNRVTAMVAIDLRVIDAVTGEVLFSQRAKGTSSMTGVASDITAGGQSFSVAGSVDQPLGKASREAIEKIVALLAGDAARVPFTARIVEVRDGRIYVNAGQEAGLRPGMEFDVYEQQPALIDPSTGRTLGTPDRLLGAIRVEDVQDKYSVAAAVNGAGFKRNHLLRFKGQKETP